LSCADSRVAPELLFDCGLGDMFVVRIAGNIVTDEVLGSLEYAVAVLEVPLLIVLGHTCCGAVTAAVEQHETPGHIGSLTTNINQALEGLDLSGDGRMQTAICANVQDGVDRLQNSEPILAPLVQAGTLTVMGAFYDVATGRVTAIDEG